MSEKYDKFFRDNWHFLIVLGLVILGEGGHSQELEGLIESENVDNIKIILPGFRKDAADCIGAFDLFVMPSRYEGFGLTLVEAMGHGIPILAAETDSLPELMLYYNNGICVDFKNPKLLTSEIPNFINKDRIAPLHKFSVEKMVDGYLTIYHSLR